MMESREYLAVLFDIYKNLLTSTEIDTFINYYIEDLSLSEIAENRSISKSSVGKTLKVTEEKLKNYENILNLYTKNKKLEKLLEENNIKLLKKELKNIIYN